MCNVCDSYEGLGAVPRGLILFSVGNYYLQRQKQVVNFCETDKLFYLGPHFIFNNGAFIISDIYTLIHSCESCAC